MLKTRTSAFLSLLLVFVSGGVVGGLVYRFYNPPPQIQQRPTLEEIRKGIINDMVKAVHLDDQQVAQVDKVMDEVRTMNDELNTRVNAEYGKIRDHQVEEIKRFLRPDQVPLYEKWLAERQAERQRRRQQKGGGKDKDRK